MSLEGLRAWIGEVERKLAKRTRVFLVLTVIAIGIGAAAIYLAIDARESSVSESDVQALQQQLETRIDALGAASATAPVVPETTPAPEAEPAPEAAPETGPKGSEKGEGGGTGNATGSTPKGATGGDASAAQLQELVEKAKERSEQGK
jgi:type II secretory pathway pseudopilin PulG